MKPLTLAVLSALLFVPAVRAQKTETDGALKNNKEQWKLKGQKPTEEKDSSGPASKPSGADNDLTIAYLEALLLKNPRCSKNAADTAQLSPDLRTKFGLVTCAGDEGVRQIVLVPAEIDANRQAVYQSIAGYKLLRARLVDHYLVLQFDKQTQYLDLLKPDQEAHLTLAGFVAEGSLNKFEDSGAFVDALENYGGVGKSSEMLSRIPALAKKAAAGKPYVLTGAKPKGEWVVVIRKGEDSSLLWPEKR